MRPLGAGVDAFWRRTALPGREVFADEDRHYARCVWLMRSIYAIAVYHTIQIGFVESHLDHATGTLRWPVLWLHWVPWAPAVAVLKIGSLATAGIGILFPYTRFLRVAAFLFVFETTALIPATGTQHHAYTMLTFVFFFALLPAGMQEKPAPDVRHRVLLLVWGALACVLLTYSMAGFMKVWGITEAVLRGDRFVLDFTRVPGHFLWGAYAYERPPVLAEWLIDHPRLASVSMWLAYYAELVSLAVAFRPNLQRWWFLALAGFHIGTMLSVDIIFVQATLVQLALFATAPFSRPGLDVRATLREIPGLGALFAAVFR